MDWIAPAIGCFTGIFAISTYWTTRFDIEPDHIVHTSGWIFRKDRRIPLNQIQNVSIRQNVLERVMGVATVDVETSMGKGRDLKLSVLKLAEAERFREELLGAAHIGGLGPANLEDPVVKLNNHDLLLGAFTENHLAQMILGAITIGTPLIGFLAKFSSRLSPVWAPLLFAVGFLILLLGSWIWGAATYYLKYGGFAVRRNEKVFRISYGLLNKVQMAIRPERIEYLHLTATIPQRWMSRASVQVGTASTFGEAGVLAPVALFVDRHRAYKGASEVIPGLNIDGLLWTKFDPIFYRAASIRSLVTVVVCSLIYKALAIFAPNTYLVPTIVLGMISALVLMKLITLFLASPENGFAITRDAILVRQGYFHQSISAIPIRRIENVAMYQPLWWKSRKATAFSVQGMKHRLSVGAMPQGAVEQFMAEWLVKVEHQNDPIAAVEDPTIEFSADGQLV